MICVDVAGSWLTYEMALSAELKLGDWDWPNIFYKINLGPVYKINLGPVISPRTQNWLKKPKIDLKTIFFSPNYEKIFFFSPKNH